MAILCDTCGYPLHGLRVAAGIQMCRICEIETLKYKNALHIQRYKNAVHFRGRLPKTTVNELETRILKRRLSDLEEAIANLRKVMGE